MARLKVFASQQGFYDTVVAVPSQKAALAAWGAHQDLFGQGMARVETDAAAVDAALARPGEVLQRPAGTVLPFTPAAEAALPEAPRIERPKSASPASSRTGSASAGSAKPSPPPKPPPDRSALTTAEHAVRDAEGRRDAEQAEIDRARAALDAREFKLNQSSRQELADLQRAVDKARRAYEKAGGTA